MSFLKKLGIGISVLFLLFILINASYFYNVGSLYFSKTPKEYDDYTLIGRFDSLLLNSSLKITTFKSLYQEQIVNLNDSTKYIHVSKLDSVTDSWYKIDETGTVIDSISLIGKALYNVDSYIINVEEAYYLSWLKDGDTTKKPIKS